MTFSLSMAGPELTPELLAVSDLDAFLSGYLLTTADNQWQAACLEVDHNDCLISAAGELAWHGLAQWRRGDDLSERLPFLPGAAQDDEPLFIDFFEASASNRVVHVHVMAVSDNRRRIVLLDATRDFARHFALQQQANELDLLTQQQDRLKTSLETANAVKARFIADMSHEFRTPLMAVLGCLDSIRAELPAAAGAMAKQVDRAEHSARHLLDLIANVLDQAQIEAGKVVLNPRPYDVRRLFADLDGIFAPIAAEKGLRWSVTVQAAVPASLSVDEARLRQVVSNLANNAIRFTGRGFVKVAADWRDDRLEIAVTDSGPGIGVAVQKSIFRALNHHQPMMVRGRRWGAGLGLSISLGLVRQMAGTLELESELGRGSCFSVSIPLAVATDQAQFDPSVLSGLELVLAESHHPVRELLNGLLSEHGVRVHAVEDGAQALQAVQQQAPGMLLIDQHLPVMSGKEVTAVLRSRGFTGAVAMMSTTPDQAEQASALAAGVNHFITKPIDRDSLIRTLCVYLSEAG